MLELLANILVCMIGVRFLNQCIAPIWSYFFINSGHAMQTSQGLAVSNSDVCIEFIVPLLCEQQNVPAIFERFGALLHTFPTTRLTLITTRRELLYLKDGETTLEIVQWHIARVSEELRDRITVWDYPSINTNLAEQLNGYLRHQPVRVERFYAVYNADSIPSENAVRCVLQQIHQKKYGIFQQSSVFLQNEEAMVAARQYFGIANGISQSMWTFAHEMPRLLQNVIFPNARLAHCVTHGLYIRSDILRHIGYFPEDSPGEDLYLGFLLRATGQVIHPIPFLESSTTPASMRAVFRQKYVWFWGPLGYWYYWRRFRNRFPGVYNTRRLWIALLTIQGVLSSCAWLLVSPILLFLTASAVFLHWAYMLPVLLYAWVPGLVFCYRTGSFSRARALAIFLYHPLVLYTHSISAWCTLFSHLYYSWTGWGTFLRPKTGG